MKIFVTLTHPQGSFYDPSCKENENVIVTNQIPAYLSKSRAVSVALNNNRLKEIKEADAKKYWKENNIKPESFSCIDIPNPMLVVKKKVDTTAPAKKRSSRRGL